MADVFTQIIVRQDGTDAVFSADVKTQLDTLTATKIDTIQYVKEGGATICYIVHHA